MYQIQYIFIISSMFATFVPFTQNQIQKNSEATDISLAITQTAQNMSRQPKCPKKGLKKPAVSSKKPLKPKSESRKTKKIIKEKEKSIQSENNTYQINNSIFRSDLDESSFWDDQNYNSEFNGLNNGSVFPQESAAMSVDVSPVVKKFYQIQDAHKKLLQFVIAKSRDPILQILAQEQLVPEEQHKLQKYQKQFLSKREPANPKNACKDQKTNQIKQQKDNEQKRVRFDLQKQQIYQYDSEEFSVVKTQQHQSKQYTKNKDQEEAQSFSRPSRFLKPAYEQKIEQKILQNQNENNFFAKAPRSQDSILEWYDKIFYPESQIDEEYNKSEDYSQSIQTKSFAELIIDSSSIQTETCSISTSERQSVRELCSNGQSQKILRNRVETASSIEMKKVFQLEEKIQEIKPLIKDEMKQLIRASLIKQKSQSSQGVDDEKLKKNLKDLENGKFQHVCQVCFQFFKSGCQLGGHMSKKHPGSSSKSEAKNTHKQLKSVNKKRKQYFNIIQQIGNQKSSISSMENQSELITLNQ